MKMGCVAVDSSLYSMSSYFEPVLASIVLMFKITASSMKTFLTENSFLPPKLGLRVIHNVGVGGLS